MAILSDADRILVWSSSQGPSGIGDPGCLKTDLRAAINAVDDWVDSNSAAFNAALPLPARTTLSAKQKAALLALVVQRRFGVL